MSVLVSALVDVRDRHGTLTPEVVVKEASDPSSPLHGSFEWDDTEAAHQWRIQQARVLIGRFKVEVQVSPKKTVKCRQFTHVRSRDEYVPTEEALGDPEMRDVVLEQARRDLAALRRKYAALVDFDKLLAEELAKAA